MERPFKLIGLIAATFTPMDEAGNVVLAGIAPMADHLANAGVSSAFVCGTTGEALSLTVSERMGVSETWAEVVGGRLQMVVHVGHTCLREARALASHAESIGATAISCMAPPYHRPASVGDLVDFCARVADAAPTTPFYYYHIPSMTGVEFPPSQFLSLAATAIPTLAGVKYTSADLIELDRCLRMGDGAFDILLGKDELMLPALTLGLRGAVGSTYCYAAPVYLGLIKAFEAGRLAEARRWYRMAIDVVEAFVKYGSIGPQKAIMEMLGVPCGPPRSPLAPMSRQDAVALEARLTEIGLMDAVRRG